MINSYYSDYHEFDVEDICTIIIPVFNVEDYILETINSIKNQTYTYWECIIVDDDCTDNSIKLLNDNIRGDTRFRVLKRPKSRIKGPSSSRNFGFENCSGEYVQFFDGDDIMHPQHLEKKISILKSNPHLDFVVCQSVSFINNINNCVFEWKNIYSDNPFEDHACAVINFLVPGPTFRRKFLDKQEMLFDESVKALEDWEFFSRILQFNPCFSPLNEVLVYYRINPFGSSQRRTLSENNFLDLINGYYSGYKVFKKGGTITSKIKKFIIGRYIPLLKSAIKLKYSKSLVIILRRILEIDPIYSLFQLVSDTLKSSKRIVHKKMNNRVNNGRSSSN